MPSKEAEPQAFADIRLAVFDLDGTVVDSFADIAAAANYGLRQMGRREVSVELATSFVGHGGRHLMRSLLGHDGNGVSDEEAERGFALWREYYSEHPADLAKPYPGAVETLGELRRRGMRTAVLSNKLDELVQSIVERLGLAPYFDAVQGEAPGEPRKPDPALLERLMHQFKATPEQTVLVGDGEADMLVARNAGVAAFGVDYGVCSPERLRELGAVVVLERFEDLLNWI